MAQITNEVAELFRKFRSFIGAPVLEGEILDVQLCDCLSMAVEDYAEKVQNWVIENNWATLYGKDLSNIDLAYAMSVRTLDISKDYSYWFSKDAGLQQRGPWELKKDFVKVEAGKQTYVIPSGREINNVMYVNPPTSQAALYVNYGGLDLLGFAGGYGQAGGGSFGPIGGFYIAQSMDVAFMATDLQYKSRLLRGDLTFKVTAGPNGTHLLHLYSTPGSKISFGIGAVPVGGINLAGCEVWYTYYESGNDSEECRRVNPNVILTPDQIPLSKMEYGLLNEPTKVIVRKLFFSRALRTLAFIRGKFSGKISIMDAEANMDYNMLMTQAEKEETTALTDLTSRLERMSPYVVMEKQAKLTEDLIKIKSGKPLKIITV